MLLELHLFELCRIPKLPNDCLQAKIPGKFLRSLSDVLQNDVNITCIYIIENIV